MQAAVRQLFGGPRPRHLLLASDGGAYTSEQQFAPIRRHAALLRLRFGVVVQYRGIDEAMTMSRDALSRFDIVGLKLKFTKTAAEAERVTQHFTQVLAGTATRMVYFDGDDDLNIQWHGVISAVDLYVKKHAFVDDASYSVSYIGKGNLTDHVARKHGVSFSEDIIQSSGGLPVLSLRKLHVGWNIALDDKIVKLARDVRTMPLRSRDIDVSCRAYVNSEVWIHGLRDTALTRMEEMAARFRVLAPRDRVSQEKYYDEMLRSRICVSPFGFGEICWRDFEAILCGCLLVKPDMGHVRTQANVYIRDVTYVPVRWDYADLEEVCAAYLADETAMVRVTEAARRTLLDSIEPSWFGDRFGELLERLDAAEVRKAVC